MFAYAGGDHMLVLSSADVAALQLLTLPIAVLVRGACQVSTTDGNSRAQVRLKHGGGEQFQSCLCIIKKLMVVDAAIPVIASAPLASGAGHQPSAPLLSAPLCTQNTHELVDHAGFLK